LAACRASTAPIPLPAPVITAHLVTAAPLVVVPLEA
jgi:hypothetical protein